MYLQDESQFWSLFVPSSCRILDPETEDLFQYQVQVDE